MDRFELIWAPTTNTDNRPDELGLAFCIINCRLADCFAHGLCCGRGSQLASGRFLRRAAADGEGLAPRVRPGWRSRASCKQCSEREPSDRPASVQSNGASHRKLPVHLLA
jgi:hypothetical protein